VVLRDLQSVMSIACPFPSCQHRLVSTIKLGTHLRTVHRSHRLSASEVSSFSLISCPVCHSYFGTTETGAPSKGLQKHLSRVHSAPIPSPAPGDLHASDILVVSNPEQKGMGDLLVVPHLEQKVVRGEKKRNESKEVKQKEKKARPDAMLASDSSGDSNNANSNNGNGSIGSGPGSGNNGIRDINRNDNNRNIGSGNNGPGINDFDGKDPIGLAAGPDACTICQDDIDIGAVDVVGRLFPCDHHSFHLQCVLEWLGRDSTCPNCREDVVSCNGFAVERRNVNLWQMVMRTSWHPRMFQTFLNLAHLLLL